MPEGKLKLINISGDVYKCKFCDVKFSLHPVSQGKLEDAVERHGDVVIGNKWDNPEPLKEGSV